jgi:hypothetical protein
MFRSGSLPHWSCEPHLIPLSYSKFTSLEDQFDFLGMVFEEHDDSLLHILALCGSVHLDPLETSPYEPGEFP